MDLTGELRVEYQHLFDSCVIRSGRVRQVDAIVDRLVAQQHRYAKVAQEVGAPWSFVGVIHNMEASLNFSRHLHNGDPLTGRTVHVPAGRPAHGQPPFTWEESAVDALRLRKIDQWSNWSTAGILYQLEGYNGWGYRNYHAHVLSPYLWSFSNHYTRGKYITDGRWSDTAVSQQCGAAVLLRRMVNRGTINSLGEGEEDAVSIEQVKKVLADMYRLLARGEIEGKRSIAHYPNSLAGLRDYVKATEENMYRLLARGEIQANRSEGHYRHSTAGLRERLVTRGSQMSALQRGLDEIKSSLFK